jgi:hypothetical protein
MIWQILLENSSNNSSAYSYMNVSSLVFNGSSETAAIQNATNYSLSPYTGGAEGCDILANNEYLIMNIKIYPIPSNDFIQISGLDTTEKIKIYTVLGIEVLKNSISNQKINIQGLTNGMYFLKFENGHTIRFIKE